MLIRTGTFILIKKITSRGPTTRKSINFFPLSPPFLCDCEPYDIAEYVTNKTDPNRSTWDLTPYQGPGIVQPYLCGRWRLHEKSAGLNYGEDEISPCGELINLPDSFKTTYSYNGYMALQIGCYNRENRRWIWPPDDYTRI